MKFKDSQLQEHYERVFASMTSVTQEMRPVCALLDAYVLFKHSDGEQAPRVHEVIEHLSALELRSGLKKWLCIVSTNETNPAATKLRRRLSEVIGEPL